MFKHLDCQTGAANTLSFAFAPSLSRKMTEHTTPGVNTEADLDARIVMPYLAALGIQADQIRAQRTFSIRLGRGMIINTGCAVKVGRLDYLITRADGQPLFVVELKGPAEELTDDDRDQGISYARLVDRIAPLVLVTNGSVSRLYDTITRERLDDPASASLIRGGGRLTDDELLQARAEALEHFIGYSAENVAAFSHAQRTVRMEPLRGSSGQHDRKYETDLYLTRNHVRQAFEDFLRSPDVVFALVGASGFGKTNEMCALAEELGATHVTLFFNGADLAASLSQVLADEFDWHFSEVLPLPQVCRRLEGIALRSGRPVLIFIDAVDEVGDQALPRELADLATRLAAFDGRVRVVVSAKPAEWERFTVVRGNPSALNGRMFVPSGVLNRSQRQDAEPPTKPGPVSAELGLFSPAERDHAIEVYSAAFGLSRKWAWDVRELACDPFMLRMIAEEAAATGTLPHEPGERDLVRRYVEQKIARAAVPERARLELTAVARALAAGVDRSERDGSSSAKRTPRAWLGDDSGATGQSFVCESDVREAAGLPATASVADELVGFGVLLRSRDRDGTARLAFAYDRVRDYIVATHALLLPDLAHTDFREAASRCLSSDIGAAALDWYLPYTSDEQWTAFIDAATRQVEILLDTYDTLRAHLATPVQAAVEPQTSGPVGIAFSMDRDRRSALGFFRRESGDLPRVCFDPAVGDFHNRRLTMVPPRLMGSRHGSGGFWFLRKPERYAATRMKEELERVAKEGSLVEEDTTLVLERVVALTTSLGSKIGFKPHPPHRVCRFADYFVGRDVFPLDLRALRRTVQIELAFRSYQDEHMRHKYNEAMERHRSAGHIPRIISTHSEWSSEDLRAWRERAGKEVDEGRDFTAHGREGDELTLLARGIDTLLKGPPALNEPQLPPPDVPESDTVSGVHNFEDGYSDEQLARLVGHVYDAALRLYDRVLADSFSAELAALLPAPEQPLGVLCFRRPIDDRPNPQFGIVVESGTAFPVDPGILDGRRAIATTVSAGGPTRLRRDGSDPWYGDTIVSTPAGRFGVRVRSSRGFVSVIWSSDSPPFVPRGSSAGRLAPVRAMVYALVTKALKDVSREQLLSLVGASEP